MKQLLSLGNGALVVSEDAGVFSVVLNDQAVLGGGEAAGVLSVKGAGTLCLNAKQCFDLAIKLLEAHSPASLVAVEEAVAAVADSVVASS